MIKKLLSMIIALSAISALICVPVAANAAPEIRIPRIEATAGETVDVPVEFLNNPGINTYALSIEYDSTYLTFTGATANGEPGGSFYCARRAVWLRNSDTDFDGVFLTLHFAVSDKAPNGDYAVSVSYNPGDIGNYDEQNVDFTVTAGKISVVGDVPEISVGSVSAVPGAKADVPVEFLNNPGINTYVLTVEYDSTYLTLDSVTSDVSGMFEWGTRAAWLCLDGDFSQSGTFLTLHFTVSEKAPNEEIPVTVSYAPGDIGNYSEQNVEFAVKAGKIAVEKAILKGDINGDGKINVSDSNFAKRIVLGDMDWVAAADINGDGKVNAADMNLLKQLILGN